ncbi:MAG: nucleotide exchange factor GrpE [Candidatus Latescibacteria bacterium]|nr:nucleotide exchange factor GrpE [Candidatus Latescibacterota bacterium]
MVINLKKGPVTQLKRDFDKCQQELKTHKENYLLALADFENFRKRKDKEMEEFRCFANENLLGELIPVLENFDRALAHIETTENYQSLKKGIDIAYRQLLNVLDKFGLKEFSCLNQEFDPKTAEAVSFIETNDKPENTIVNELNKGYEYQNRVIRPARVIVSKPVSQKSESQELNSGADGCKKESDS